MWEAGAEVCWAGGATRCVEEAAEGEVLEID